MGIIETAQSEGAKRFQKLDFIPWCREYIYVKFDGKWIPFSFDGHEYLRQIYNLPFEPRFSAQKAAQTAISTYAMLRNLYLGEKYAITIVYYFPTDTDVQDFSQDRFNPMIDHSEHLSSMMTFDKADNLGLKQIGQSSIYFRGVVSKRKVKSVDADGIVKDEVDEANQENLEFAEDRVLHSTFKWIMELSQPSIPDFGINESFMLSDQRFWMVKCPACGRQNNIVEQFPDNLKTKGKGDKLIAWIGCKRCGKKLDTQRGEYVPKHPSRSKDHIGVQVSQLFTSTVDAKFIYEKLRKATRPAKKKNLYVSLIGLPYMDSELYPFSERLFLENESRENYGFAKEAGSSFMGIDVGDICHVVVLGWTGNRLRLIHLEEILADDKERFHNVIEKFRSFFVIDAMPYKTLGKGLCLRYKGWGAIQYFKGDTLTEGTEGENEFEVPCVKHDRTESIDEMNDVFKESFFIMPNPKALKPDEAALYETFKKQVKMLEKTEEEDKNGYPRYVYKKRVNNHFGMALNSAYIAFRIGKGYFAPTVDPIFG